MAQVVERDLMPLVDSFNARNADLRVTHWSFSVSTHIDVHMVAGLLDVAWWALGGVAASCVYMWLHTNSLSLTLAGMFGLLLAFPLTWFVYTTLFRYGEVRTHARICACTHARICACTHLRMHASAHARICASVHARICACTHLRMHASARCVCNGPLARRRVDRIVTAPLAIPEPISVDCFSL